MIIEILYFLCGIFIGIAVTLHWEDRRRKALYREVLKQINEG